MFEFIDVKGTISQSADEIVFSVRFPCYLHIFALQDMVDETSTIVVSDNSKDLSWDVTHGANGSV